MKKFGRAGSTLATVLAAAIVLAIVSTTGAVAGSLITSKRIKNNTIKSIDVRNGTLKGIDVKDGSLTGADIADGSLSNQDINVLFATVNANGSLANSSGGVTSSNFALGQYDVNFGRDVSQCAFVASPADPGAGSASSRQINVADRSNPQAVFVNTETSDGTNIDESFHLVVVC